MLKPLFLAYEATNGNVQNISRMNQFFKESTGDLKSIL